MVQSLFLLVSTAALIKDKILGLLTLNTEPGFLLLELNTLLDSGEINNRFTCFFFINSLQNHYRSVM